jgi:hypothetical protein
VRGVKFELEEKIRIKSTGKKGVIKGYKFETAFSYGKVRESKKYYIRIENNHFYWFDESDIALDEYTFDSKFELGLSELLIDVNLLAGNYEQVKIHIEQKQQLGGK